MSLEHPRSWPSCFAERSVSTREGDHVTRPQDGEAKAYGRIVAKAWSDDAFKQRLLADPAAALQAEGLPVAAGVELRVVENTDKVAYLTLPAKPAELSDEMLDKVAGGIL